MIRGLIFDFDGLILETESPIYQSWLEVYHSCGKDLPFERVAQLIGTAENEPDLLEELEKEMGAPLDRLRLAEFQQRRERELVFAQPPRPGVIDYLCEARRLELRIALASSATCSWVTGHLTRLGLIHFFDAIQASDDVAHTKPDPELFRSALQALGLQADEVIVFEDSQNGILAAKRAGLFCVVVPNEMTKRLSLNQADVLIGSMAEVPLEQLLEQVNLQKQSVLQGSELIKKT